jgi:hypothetical protein
MRGQRDGGHPMKRYVIEGTWSGYHSGQRRVAHREVIAESRAKKFVLTCIRYTDGTTLDITLRPAEYREKVKEISGYRSLIRDAEMLGKSYVTVDELCEIERQAKAAAEARRAAKQAQNDDAPLDGHWPS